MLHYKKRIYALFIACILVENNGYSAVDHSSKAEEIKISDDNTMMFSGERKSLTNIQSNDAQYILRSARKKLEEAEYLAEQIVEAARIEAKILSDDSNKKIVLKKMNTVSSLKEIKGLNINKTLFDIKHEEIAIEVNNLPLREVLLHMLPNGWRVKIDMDKKLMQDQRIDFISQKKRDEAISDLMRSLGLEYQYFYNLKNTQGVHSPLIVVTSNE